VPFYIYAGIERFAPDSGKFAVDVLEDAGVAITPGKDFGANQAERYVRFAYTRSMSDLQEGVRRLGKFLSSPLKNASPRRQPRAGNA